MNGSRKIVIGILMLMLLVASEKLCFAQTEYRITHYDTKDGLANEYAKAIVQDSMGFLWIHFGTGLSRFDGHNFKIYRHDPNDSSNTLGNIFEGSLIVDPSGNVWATNNQTITNNTSFVINKFNKNEDRFIQFTPQLEGALITRKVFSKTDGLLWLATQAGRGIFSFDTKTGKTKNYVNPHMDSLTKSHQNNIRDLKDYGSFILLATRNGLWKFDKLAETFERPKCNPIDSALLYNSVIDRIMDRPNQDDLNNVWLKIQSTIVRINSDFSVIHRYDFPKELTWGSWDRDSDGVFWFSANGLNRYDPRDNSITKIKSIPGDPTTLRSDRITDICVDRDQNIWVATAERGISKLQRRDLKFFNFNLGENVTSTTGYKAIETDYLVVTRNKTGQSGDDEILFTSIDPDRLDLINFKHFSTEKPIIGHVDYSWKGKNNFWIGTYDSGILALPINPKSGMIESHPVKILRHDPININTISGNNSSGIWEDSNENLWIATYGNGLSKVIPGIPYGTAGSVHRYNRLSKDSNSISNDVIWWEFMPEDKNSFWVITASGVDLFREGRFEHIFKSEHVITVAKYSDTLFVGTLYGLFEGIKKGDSYQFTKNSKLKHQDILALKQDKNGRLWITSNEGVVCYDRKKNLEIKFTESDGIDFTIDWIYQTDNGILVTADSRGISLFDPATFEASTNKTHPALVGLIINNYKIDGKKSLDIKDFSLASDVTVLNELVLDYQHNNFALEFSSMEMIAPEKNLYKHKLEGYDKEWIETDWKNRTATYTNLPSGDYTFRVKASNHHGVWSDNERTLKVIILPPPWRTWWAYTGYGLLFLGALYASRRSIVQRERLKANLKLEHLELEKAQEVDKMKTSFFTNISHEFRTPLTLIKGPVQNLLEKYMDNPKTGDQLKMVQRNSDLLLKLINQLLDLAKLESGTLKVEKSEGDLYSFIRAIASSFSSFASQKNVTVQVEVPAERCYANFDKDKLETILINLINNAIKFTPSGGTVIVNAVISEEEFHAKTQSRKGSLSLKVSDTGIGISEEHQSKIFERFHQVSEAHKEVGTGIGLALVKELIGLMNGIITVTSEVGKGSEFKVVLPIEITNSQSTSSRQSTIVEPVSLENGISNVERPIMNNEVDSTKPHVLVVEDNTDLRHFIIDSLGDEFYFLEAENGKIGLNIATTEVPDLIVSDVMMPEMDGITMATKIKNDIRTSHIPLILLTAKSTEDSKLSGLQSGADDYLTKPFNKQELLLKVRNGVNRQLKLREKLRADLMSTAPKVEVLSADEQFLNDVKEGILKRLSDEQLSVESLAEDMGMSRVQLYRKVTGLTGMSVNELIRKLRLQRAAQLLQQKWGPVSQVAYEVGFSNLSYFSKVFKEEFGVLPSEYESLK